MDSLSRRSFLQLCGVTLAAVALPAASASAELPPMLYGRALHAAAITARPDPAAREVGRLWPDTIATLREVSGGFYAMEEGFVPVEAVQPMPGWDAVPALVAIEVPGWVEVGAPVAPLRGWAAANAPLASRIGYGGVLYALDRLTNPDGTSWLAVGSLPEGAPLGWTPADRWRPVTLSDQAATDKPCTLRLDRKAAALVALEEDREILRAPAAVPVNARPGTVHLTQRGPTLPDVPAGAAWVLGGPEALIYGVHWHNCFGGPGEGPGWEVLPWVARWLSGWLAAETPVRVV